jgi:hypothetical protein
MHGFTLSAPLIQITKDILRNRNVSIILVSLKMDYNPKTALYERLY